MQTEPRSFNPILAIPALALLYLLGCAVPGYNKGVPPQAPSPPSSESPPEPEKITRCAFTNGAGRFFSEKSSTRFIAESNARRACERSYRNCTLFKCEEVNKDSE